MYLKSGVNDDDERAPHQCDTDENVSKLNMYTFDKKDI